MKTIEGFKLRKLGNEYILVGESMALINFNKMITLNETGAFIWHFLQEAHTKEELLAAMLEESDVDEADARADIEGFTGVLLEQGMLEE